MKSIKTVIFIFFISNTIFSYSQNYNKNSVIGISTGFEKSHIKDQAFSSLRYSSFSSSYHVRFNLQKKKHTIPVFIDFSMGKIHTHVDYFTATFIRGNFDIGYLYQIFLKKAFSNKTRIFMGTGFSSYLQYLDFREQESFSFFFLHSVDFKLSFLYNLAPRSHIESYLSIPLAGLLVRPPYAGFDEELEENQSKPLRLLTNGGFVTSDKVFSFRNRILYRYSLSNRFTISCAYVIKYISVSSDFDKGYRNAENNLLIGMDFMF